jgi:predicted acyl esterase
MAAKRAPGLKAVIAIYASDDRFTDDVHLCGGSRRWLDLVDYCHYVTPMNALPPVPAVWGDGWRDEWAARIAEHEPWLFSWLEHTRRDDYWQHGSIRPVYDDIECPVLLVAGWADGYRNNSFRTVAALRAAGRHAELLAGPWPHAATSSCLPGPRIDLVPEMVAWWDRWLRGRTPVVKPPTARWYARASHRPAVDLDHVPGVWRADEWPNPRSTEQTWPLSSKPPYDVVADIGLTAWLSCSGHLPWGQPDDQRTDDVRALTWDWPLADGLEIAGYPHARLRISVSEPVASVALRLCDVAPDGTSTLVSRGFLNLTRRAGMATATPLVPGEVYNVDVEIEATAWQWAPGHVLRLALAGADWPNVIAPPTRVSLTIHGGELVLPTYDATTSPYLAPVFTPGDEKAAEDPAAITWRIWRDVLARVTGAVIDHGGDPYDTPYGRMGEHYFGEVRVQTDTFAQSARSEVTFAVHFDNDGSGAPVDCVVASKLHIEAGEADLDVVITMTCTETSSSGEHAVGERSWKHRFARDLA